MYIYIGAAEMDVRGRPWAAAAAQACLLEAESQRAEVRHVQLRLRELLGRLERGVDGGDDEVLERLRILRVDRLLLDLDLQQLPGTRRLDDDSASARGALDGLVRHRLLRLLHLRLHLLRLLHQLLEVHRHQSVTSVASKVSL